MASAMQKKAIVGRGDMQKGFERTGIDTTSAVKLSEPRVARS